MSRGNSLLAGRNPQPLDDAKQRRVANTFLGLDANVNVRYDEHEKTGFHVINRGTVDEYGEIIFGPDIYPGQSIIDPNSALSMEAAAAHELTHYHRWKDMLELTEEALEEIDEAMTSLQALSRFERQLSDQDKKILAADAYQRLQRFVQAREGNANNERAGEHE